VKLIFKRIIIGVSLLAGCYFVVPQKSLAATESNIVQGSTMGSEADALAEHESDGPEGTRGVPMQRPSMIQIALVLLVLAAGGSLAWKGHRAWGCKNE
jgi:hypothetical protein